MKLFKKIALGVFLTLLSLFIIAGTALSFLIIPTVTFDFSSQSELTGRASGFLYGFAEEDIPSSEIAESIGINALATKTAGGLQHPIGDVRDVSDTFLSAGGEMLMVYTQDMYDTWYYQLDSLEEYNEKVKKTVTEMENSPYKDSLVYCIYNEMDNGAWLGSFWEEENRYKFYDAWKDTYNLVKEINPDAKIAGPGHCGYNYDFIKEFLVYCKGNDCLPEVVVWHELSDQSIYRIKSNFEGYYSVCDELGIERLPVCISEYGLMRTNGIPGESVKWISRLEEQDAYGCVAYWRLANNLSDTVSDDVTPNSNYWVYNFYAKMKGKELHSEEWDMLHSNIGNWLKGKYPLMNKGFIALSSFDDKEEKFYILTGGSDRSSKIRIKNLGDAFSDGEKLTAKISYVDYKGLGGAVNTPVTAEIKSITVKGGSITFSVPAERESQAFFIEITKGEAEEFKNSIKTVRFEAEDMALSEGLSGTDAVAYSVSSGKCVKGITKSTPVSFTVKAKEEGTYTFDVIYSNVNTGDTGRRCSELKVLINGEEDTLRLPSTIKEDCMECVSFDTQLKKGKNTVTLCPAEGDIIGLDFVDVTRGYRLHPIGFGVLSSRNTKEENAHFVTAPFDACYTLLGTENADFIIINGTKAEGNADGVFYLSRGYNKIVLPENKTVSEVQLTVRDFGTEIFTPDDVTLLGEAVVSDNENTSTGRCIGWISSENGGGIEFTVNTSKAGVYAVTIEYANNEEGGYHDYNVDLVERYISLFVNGEKKGNCFFRSTYSWDHFKTKTIMVELSEGENRLTITNDRSYSFNNRLTYAPDIGSISVNKVS
ncbi:MAG: carbohydrate-binding protein [Ruminococcaceae bacterium]|nr:carbohydrate-binding protein [Oscillospiraceae bacterium]